MDNIYVLKEIHTNLKQSWDYNNSLLSSNQNVYNDSFVNFYVILVIIIAMIPIIILIYVLVKLHQISKYTKKTYLEIEKLNRNIYNVFVKNKDQ